VVIWKLKRHLSAKDEVPVCVGSDWENNFIAQLGCGSGSQEQEEEEDEECGQESSEVDEAPELTVKTFSEALQALDCFLRIEDS